VTQVPPLRRHPDAGFTLVEVLVALAIFALIGVAGFSMLDQVLRTQALTEGRLERLAEMQRAMHLITLDFSQAQGASLTVEGSADGTFVGLQRHAVEARGGSVTLRYAVQDGTLIRDVSGPSVARQALLAGVTGVDWQFYEPGAGWASDWPPMGRVVLPGQSAPNPLAVAVTIRLAANGNQLRKVVLLPGEVR
jgi:general secretion pathway protein J